LPLLAGNKTGSKSRINAEDWIDAHEVVSVKTETKSWINIE